MSSESDPIDVCIVKANGTGLSTLTTDDVAKWAWSWSSDAPRIAFFSAHACVPAPWVRVLDESEPLIVAAVETLTAEDVSNDLWESSHPRCSPTGSHVSYNVQLDVGGETTEDIDSVGPPGGKPVIVCENSRRNVKAACSRHGTPVTD